MWADSTTSVPGHSSAAAEAISRRAKAKTSATSGTGSGVVLAAAVLTHDSFAYLAGRFSGVRTEGCSAMPQRHAAMRRAGSTPRHTAGAHDWCGGPAAG